MNKMEEWVARRNVTRFRLQLSEIKPEGEKATLLGLLEDEQRKLSPTGRKRP